MKNKPYNKQTQVEAVKAFLEASEGNVMWVSPHPNRAERRSRVRRRVRNKSMLTYQTPNEMLVLMRQYVASLQTSETTEN